MPYFSSGATDCGCNSNASHQHWPDTLTALHGPSATDAIAVDVVVEAYDTVKVQGSLAEIAMASICMELVEESGTSRELLLPSHIPLTWYRNACY